MDSQDPTPPFGEPQRSDAQHEAWSLVLDALESALDVDGLPARDRGLLANLHDAASTYLGDVPVVTPAADPAVGARDALERMDSKLGELQAVLDKRIEVNKRFLAGVPVVTPAADPAVGARDALERMDSKLGELQAVLDKRIEVNKRFLAGVGRRRRTEPELGDLDIDTPTFQALHRAGVRLVADIDRHVREGSLLSIRGIGPRRAAAIVAARHGATDL